MQILYAVVFLGGLGLMFALLLAFAEKKFLVPEDALVAKVCELLPGINCGVCGHTGCDALASAIIKSEAPITACPILKEAKIAAIEAIVNP